MLERTRVSSRSSASVFLPILLRRGCPRYGTVCVELAVVFGLDSTIRKIKIARPFYFYFVQIINSRFDPID